MLAEPMISELHRLIDKDDAGTATPANRRRMKELMDAWEDAEYSRWASAQLAGLLGDDE